MEKIKITKDQRKQFLLALKYGYLDLSVFRGHTTVFANYILNERQIHELFKLNEKAEGREFDEKFKPIIELDREFKILILSFLHSGDIDMEKVKKIIDDNTVDLDSMYYTAMTRENLDR